MAKLFEEIRAENQWIMEFLDVDELDLLLSEMKGGTPWPSKDDFAGALKLRLWSDAERETEILRVACGINNESSKGLLDLTQAIGSLIAHFGDFFSRSALSAATKVLLDETNKFRLAFFCLALREISTSVLTVNAPVDTVKATDWYSPTHPRSVAQKVKPNWSDHSLFQITGAFDWKRFVPNFDLGGAYESLREHEKVSRNLSKYTHFTHDNLIFSNEVILEKATEFTVELKGLLRALEMGTREATACFCERHYEQLQTLIDIAKESNGWTDDVFGAAVIRPKSEHVVYAQCVVNGEVDAKPVGVIVNGEFDFSTVPPTVTLVDQTFSKALKVTVPSEFSKLQGPQKFNMRRSWNVCVTEDGEVHSQPSLCPEDSSGIGQAT